MQHPAIAVAKSIPDVFVEDNKTNDVQLDYSGFNCWIVTVSGNCVAPYASRMARMANDSARRLAICQCEVRPLIRF
jgi:hypothetical protein